MESNRPKSRDLRLDRVWIILLMLLLPAGPAWGQLADDIAVCDHVVSGPIASGDPALCTAFRIFGEDSDDPTTKTNIVFLGDGFKKEELPVYRCAVQSAVGELLGTHPMGALADTFNIYRVDVFSPDSGIDRCRPITSGSNDYQFPTDLERTTALETGFCGGIGSTIPKVRENALIISARKKAKKRIAKFAEIAGVFEDYIVVLTNSSIVGGSGGYVDKLAFVSIIKRIDEGGMFGTRPRNYGSFERLVVHEIGHALFNLEDEYCDESDRFECVETGAQTAEPNRANVTIAHAPLADVKWADLVVHPPASTTLLDATTGSAYTGTLEDAEGKYLLGIPLAACSATPPDFEYVLQDPTSVLAPDLVGLFEGGDGSSCGIFHPLQSCRMNETTSARFCPVCRRRILRGLAKYLPEDNIRVIVDSVYVKKNSLRSVELLTEVGFDGDIDGSTDPVSSTYSQLEWPGHTDPKPIDMSHHIGKLAADLVVPANAGTLTVRFSWPGDPCNNPVGVESVSFSGGDPEMFGAAALVHVLDRPEYRVYYSIVSHASSSEDLIKADAGIQ